MPNLKLVQMSRSIRPYSLVDIDYYFYLLRSCLLLFLLFFTDFTLCWTAWTGTNILYEGYITKLSFPFVAHLHHRGKSILSCSHPQGGPVDTVNIHEMHLRLG
ncbi:hypothetical protein BC827DRAFT_135233 [Russula dissimulans]|nr:hypothetical protein BC827DRAFT_135233 [Russula dissimulans]